MNETLKALIFGNIPSIMCIGAATYLSCHGLDGWGWFLFVAVILHVTVRANKSDE